MDQRRTDKLPSGSLRVDSSGRRNSETDTQSVGDLSIPSIGISFYIMRIARTIIVRTDIEFLIGRTAEENASSPMLNLEEFDGFSMGVSRQHAIVRPVEFGYEIIDLASRNGTWLGDQRLSPHKPYPLISGDVLRIGVEQLLVRYNAR